MTISLTSFFDACLTPPVFTETTLDTLITAAP